MKQTVLLKGFFLTVLFQAFLTSHCFSQDFKKEKKKIIADLENAFRSDQKVRAEFNACVAASGSKNEACQEKRKILEKQDSVNRQVVSKVLDQYGWLSKKQISKDANKAFFYVIQHAPLQFQSKYANLIDTAFKTGQINAVEYAFFVDRFRSKQGLSQYYGTQAETDNLGNNYLYPVKNWDTINTIRANLKLPPLDFSQIPEYGLYPKTMNGDTIVLIGHMFDKTNAPIPNAIVSLDSKILGQSNDKGLFIISLKRPTEGAKILVQAKGKQNTSTIKGPKDFYSIYMQF